MNPEVEMETMDKLIMAAADVQELQYRIHCAVELVRAVHTTITEGPHEPDEKDYDALFGAHWLLHILDVEMKETGERLWNAVCAPESSLTFQKMD